VQDVTKDGRFAKSGGAPKKHQFGEDYIGFDRDTGLEIIWRVINTEKVDPGKKFILIME